MNAKTSGKTQSEIAQSAYNDGFKDGLKIVATIELKREGADVTEAAVKEKAEGYLAELKSIREEAMVILTDKKEDKEKET